jgi:cbb3-type cytochrome oxidase maturation protein
LLVLIPLSLLLVAIACIAFFWAVDTAQFDNLDSRGWDVLEDDSGRDPADTTTVIGRRG